VSNSCCAFTYEYYTEHSGNCPVRKFLKNLKALIGQKEQRIAEAIEKLMVCLSRNEKPPYTLASPLRDKLWELKVEVARNPYRLIYCIVDKQVIFLHGFHKKTQEVLQHDIDIAKERYAKLKLRYSHSKNGKRR
jgi:phage-related protein